MTYKKSGAHPKCLTLMILPKDIFESTYLQKNPWSIKSMQNYRACKALTELQKHSDKLLWSHTFSHDNVIDRLHLEYFLSLV